MNFIKQFNTFFENLLTEPLSSNAVYLYFTLFYINNKCNWKKEFRVSNSTLMGLTGFDKNKVDRARNELKQKNYISYSNGKNQFQAGIYEIFNFDTALNTAFNIELDTAHEDINKINKTKERNKKEMIEIYNSICTNLPKVQKVTDKRNKLINTFLKGFSLDEFKHICKLANNNNFLTGENDKNWKADFDFLINPNKATNILEGKYGNNDKTHYKIEGGLQLL